MRAPADGLYASSGGFGERDQSTLYEKLNFNFIRDIAPVAGIMRAPLLIEVGPSVPAKTVSEFISYAKSNPGKINMAPLAIGTSAHVSGELFKMMAGINMVHVPYRGGAPMITDLLGGQVHVVFDIHARVNRAYQVGKLSALAVTTAMRSEALPEVPTVNSFVPGYEASYVNGVGAPKDTPNRNHRQAQ